MTEPNTMGPKGVPDSESILAETKGQASAILEVMIERKLSLQEMVDAFEQGLIRAAFEKSTSVFGGITKAAGFLRTSHQNLRSLVTERHKALLAVPNLVTPRKPRLKSIITRPQERKRRSGKK